MKKFIRHLKEKGYKIHGIEVTNHGIEFIICTGYKKTAMGRQKSYWLELK